LRGALWTISCTSPGSASWTGLRRRRPRPRRPRRRPAGSTLRPFLPKSPEPEGPPMERTRAAAPFALLLLAAGAVGQGMPGDLYVTERAAGSVVNVRNGGNFTGAPRFATGLSGPTGICVTTEGVVLVSE